MSGINAGPTAGLNVAAVTSRYCVSAFRVRIAAVCAHYVRLTLMAFSRLADGAAAVGHPADSALRLALG
jgi:hypothetical protein